MKKIDNFKLIPCFLILLLFSTVVVNAQTVTLSGIDDAVAQENVPGATANELHGSNIFVNGGDSVVIAMVKFDISNFAGRVVDVAKFSTRSDMADDSTMTVQLTSAGNGFSRDTTTWENKPSTGGDELASVMYNDDSGRKVFANNESELENYINSKLAEGSSYVSFAIKYKSGAVDDLKWIGGVGDGGAGPNLELTFGEGYSSYASDDATVFEKNPTWNANELDANNIFVGEAPDSTVIAYVKFDISTIKGQIVESVEFSTRSDMADDSTMTVALTEADPDFSRDTTNWDNRPNTGNELATVIYDDDSGRKIFTPTGTALVDYVNKHLTLGKEEIAFALKFEAGAGDQLKWIGGKGNGAWGPLLEFTFGVGTAEVDLMPTADATAFEKHPDWTANELDAANIFVAEAVDSTVISFVKFDISAFQGKVVESAEFSTRSDMADDSVMTVKLTEAGAGFQRDTTNWSNKPSTGDELATVVYDDDSGRKIFTETGSALVDYINGKLANGETEVAFGLEYKDGAGDQLKWIGGKGNGPWGPMLKFSFARNYAGFGLDDATVFEKHPDWTANELDANNIFVGEAPDSTVIAFIKFYVGNISGQEVATAGFSTRSDMADDSVMTVNLTPAEPAFSRDTTNWDNQPSSTDRELASVVYDDDSGRKIFTPNGAALVDYINEKLATGEEELAFAIKHKSGAGDQLKWIGGVGNGNWGPKLEMEFVQPLQNDTILTHADTYVDEETPDANYGQGADMKIRKDNASTSKEVLVKFDISEVADAIVGSAKLAVYIAQHSSASPRDNYYVEVMAVNDQSWLENTVTWNNKPQTGDKLIEADVFWHNAGRDTVWTSARFTHYLNEAIKQGEDSVSFLIRGKEDTGEDRLWMADHDWKNGARLILDYSVEPPAQDAPVIADTYVSQTEPDQNFSGEADQHLIKDEQGEASKWVYLKYDISKAYGEVVSATLNIYAAIHNTATAIDNLPFAVYESGNIEWLEDTVTWNNKPVTGDMLADGIITESKYYEISTPDLTDYVNAAIEADKDSISFVVKATQNTPGNRGWVSGMNYKASSLILNYEPQVQAPTILPAGGNFIKEVEVEVTSLTANSTVYYTTDGTTPDDNSTEYTGPVMLTDTTVLSVIAYAPELKPSPVVSYVYNVTPVGLPQFHPSPVVKYPDSVTIAISVVPEDAVIRYSTDGSAPTTLYEGPIFLEDDAVIKAQAFSADFTFATEVVEVNYDIIPTNLEPGVGPGGVGYKDLTRTGQPLVSMWLKPEALTAADGDEVTTWPDMSGNGNDAYNTYQEGGNNAIPNTGESQKPAPIYREDAVNGMPALEFGTAEGERGSLIVDDADNLDGSSSISMFVVFKRNEMFGDFAAVLQKRDITADASQETYTLEMNGGSNPNEMQVVFNKKLFLQNDQVFNMEDYYIVNASVNGDLGIASFVTNGFVENTAAFTQILNNSHAPVIVGGFQAMNIAEVLTFNSTVNHAQTTIINNYLAAKYGLTLTDGTDNTNLYTDDTHIYDVIGVGKATDLDNSTVTEHNYSSGSGLEIQGLTLGDNSFVFAGHNGAEVATATNWERKWNVETSGEPADVKLTFDFEAVGLTAPTDATGYMLMFDDGAGAVDMAIDPVLTDGKIDFTVNDIQDGIYYIAKEEVGIESLAGNSKFKLYPTPVQDELNIAIINEFNGMVNINIYDLAGNLVVSERMNKTTNQLHEVIAVGHLEAGVYLIEMKNGEFNVSRKIIKQ